MQVAQTRGSWTFTPKGPRAQLTSLLFFPGAVVSPVAYAPLARAVAIAGYPATILKLPRRGAFGGADDPELFVRARALMTAAAGPNAWVVAGHSRGAVVATQSPDEVNANRHNLPPSTHWVWIEGGNHSQFGWYGFQPGDRFARIPAADQRAIMTEAVLEMIRAVNERRAPAFNDRL
jgi:hypothetical protein